MTPSPDCGRKNDSKNHDGGPVLSALLALLLSRTGTDRKNLAGLRSYPDAVQRAVREHPVLGKAAPKEKSTLSILLGNLLLFTVVFSALGLAPA